MQKRGGSSGIMNLSQRGDVDVLFELQAGSPPLSWKFDTEFGTLQHRRKNTALTTPSRAHTSTNAADVAKIVTI